MTQLSICIIIFVISLVLYATNIIPMGITSLISMAALVVTGCLDGKAALSGFANTNTVVIVGMFVVAAGFNRTSFVDKMSKAIVKVSRGSFMTAYAGYLLLAVLLTNFLPSPMTVFAIVSPLLASSCEEFKVSPSKVMFALCVVCVGCCGILPFGSAITTASQNNRFFMEFGFTDVSMTAMDILLARWPMIILILVWALFLAPKTAPAQPVVPISGITGNAGKKEKKPLPPFAETMGVVIFFGVILLMIFGSALNIPNWQVCFIGALLTVICGVQTEKEAVSSMPISIACLYVGALGMGSALTATGAGEVMGNVLAKMVGHTTNSYVLCGLFFIIPFILTQFMMNQGVMNVFRPICLLTCSALGANPICPMIMVTAGSLTAFLTPMATPAVPMAMGMGGYDVKSLFKQGWLITLLISAGYILYSATVLPAF